MGSELDIVVFPGDCAGPEVCVTALLSFSATAELVVVCCYL